MRQKLGGSPRRAGIVGLRVIASVSLLVASVGACGSSRREADAIVRAVDFFRRADNEAKPSAIEVLRSARCQEAEACRARDACLASGEATVKALKLRAGVAREVVAIDAGVLSPTSPRALELPSEVEEAEALLAEGFERLIVCDEQILALKRRHGL